jgi:hypothetical protein
MENQIFDRASVETYTNSKATAKKAGFFFLISSLLFATFLVLTFLKMVSNYSGWVIIFFIFSSIVGFVFSLKTEQKKEKIRGRLFFLVFNSLYFSFDILILIAAGLMFSDI